MIWAKYHVAKRQILKSRKVPAKKKNDLSPFIRQRHNHLTRGAFDRIPKYAQHSTKSKGFQNTNSKLDDRKEG